MDIRQDILEIITEFIDAPLEEINTSEGLKTGCGINSFMLFSMISNIEEHFGISIPNSALMQFKTIDDIINYITDTTQ